MAKRNDKEVNEKSEYITLNYGHLNNVNFNSAFTKISRIQMAILDLIAYNKTKTVIVDKSEELGRIKNAVYDKYLEKIGEFQWKAVPDKIPLVEKELSVVFAEPVDTWFRDKIKISLVDIETSGIKFTPAEFSAISDIVEFDLNDAM